MYCEISLQKSLRTVLYTMQQLSERRSVYKKLTQFELNLLHLLNGAASILRSQPVLN
jgi:hypothetical protein